MRADCVRCYKRCRQCVQHNPVLRPAVKLRSTQGKRPYLRRQMDVYKVNPPGEGGVTAVLSVICTYPRFIYLRGITSVDAQTCADALVDVFLDMGVVPVVVQSD